MPSDEYFAEQARFRRETLDSIFEEDPQPDPRSQRNTRRHAALSMELDALENTPDSPLNRSRAEIVADLKLVIEDIKAEYE